VENNLSVDVVIPCFNGSQYIKECILSVLNQTFSVCHIIVVNDGSTDSTSYILKELQGLDSRIIVIDQTNRGLPYSRNIGAIRTDSTHIAFLDADDFWLPNKLSNQIKIARDSPQISVASEYLIFRHGEIVLPRARSTYLEIKPKGLLTFNQIIPGSGSSSLIARDIFIESGGFSEDLEYAEDLDLWIRLASLSEWKISKSSDVVIRHNPHGMQSQRKISIIPYLNSSFKIVYRYKGLLTKFEYFALIGYLSFSGWHASGINYFRYRLSLKDQLLKINMAQGIAGSQRMLCERLIFCGFFYSLHLKIMQIF
jgi:glycosyltransferase involved in cell wall biosynthesis